MTNAHRTGLAVRVVGIVVLEYLLVIAAGLWAIHRFSFSPARAISAAALLFSALTIGNFLLARRLFRRDRRGPVPAPAGESEEVARLREEFHYLRWYLDELVENWNTPVLVLDRSLLVRWMNRAGRDLLALREKAELVGRPFRLHPLAGATYRGQVSAFRNRPLGEVLAACCAEGTPVLLEKIACPRGNGGDPVLLDILATPWGERTGETSRLVLRLDRSARDGAPAKERSGEGERRAAPAPEENGDLLLACDGMRSRLEALRLSCRSLAAAAGPAGNGALSEAVLLESQADRIGEELNRLARTLEGGEAEAPVTEAEEGRA